MHDEVERGLKVVETAIDMMSNNRFKEAIRFLKPK